MTQLEILTRSFASIAIPDFMPKGRALFSGVYLLVAYDEIVYIGSSSEVEMRIWTHRLEKRSGKTFDRSFWYGLPELVLPHYEGAFIRALRPRHNRSAPKHAGYDNEILSGFGLPILDDEYANSRTWLSLRPGAQPKRIPPPIGARIKAWRKRRKLTQAAVAVAVGCSGAAVAQWECGDSTPSTDSVTRLADAFGVSLAEFYGAVESGPVPVH